MKKFSLKFIKDKNIVKERINNILENKFSKKYLILFISTLIVLLLIIIIIALKCKLNPNLSIINLSINGANYEINENKIEEIDCLANEKIIIKTYKKIDKIDFKNLNLNNEIETNYNYYCKNNKIEFETWNINEKILYKINIIYSDGIEKNYEFILNIK